MTGPSPFTLPPAEAIKWFREKGYALSFDYRDLYGKEHARAFTVAKATQLDLLGDIRSALDKALAKGMTLQEFTRQLRPELQRRGWWGEQEQVDPKTGEKKLVQLGSPQRLRTIYQTNMRQAQAAGRWERMERTRAERPYLRYVCLVDGLERKEHREWHNTVLPADDPWWDTHSPPNGWGCRCRIQQLSERELARLRAHPVLGKDLKTVAPEDVPRIYENPRTGARVRVPRGIDPGFEYNPGAEPRAYNPGHAELDAPALKDSRTWRDEGLPSAAEIAARGGIPHAAERWHAVTSIADADARYVTLFGTGRPTDVADPTGQQVTFSPKMLEHLIGRERDFDRLSFLPRAKQAVEDPSEIWLVPHRITQGPRAGEVVLRKRYIAIYAGRSQQIAVVAQRTEEGYAAWTAYPSNVIDKKRNGYLLMSRGNAGAAPPPTRRNYLMNEHAADAALDRLGRDRVEVRMVPIGQIRAPESHSPERSAAIAKALAAGTPLPPVRLLSDGKQYAITDGNHRIAAALAAGHTHVPAIVPRRR